MRMSPPAIVIASLFLWACSSEDDGARGGDGADDTGSLEDVFFPEVDSDATGDATGPDDTADGADGADDSNGADGADGDTSGPCNTFGCACTSNADCLDELCIAGPDGRVCSSTCVTGCPDAGFACVPIVQGGPDPFNACVPLHPNLCRPCRDDAECKNELMPNATALCVAAPDPKDGRFCASSCENGAPCPDGYTCSDVALDGGGSAKQCIPTDGTCECRPAWASMGLVTDCLRENATGTCHGERTCGIEGLTACDAPPASAESCNGEDDDCDGATDDLVATACTMPDNGIGACPGTTACQGGGEVCEGTAATNEACNLVDDDCDGDTDEDTCGDGLACTEDVCAAAGQCDHPIVAGTCLIGGRCWADNEANPEFPCQRCVPAVSTTSWTGSDDGPSCFIGGECYPAGAGKPGEPCLRCRPDVATTTWSPAAAADQIACDDGNACTKEDTCNGGACLGATYSCDDGKLCTDNVCDGAGGCDYPVVAGACLIDDTCYTEGQRPDATTCRVCDAATPRAWSAPTTALSCDDGEPCTKTDVCAGATCGGTGYDCDDATACTLDACDGAGGCTHSAAASFCVIDGACVADGGKDPDNECQACKRATSASAWTPYAAAEHVACDDSIACTKTDQCNGGGCLGVSYSCGDGQPCTDDVCDGAGGCDYPVIAGNCLIDDQCYSDGERDDAANCNVCNAATPDAWSPAASALTCDDADLCSSADVCTGFVCDGSSYSCNDGASCTTDACHGTGPGDCTHTLKAGNCFIGGACYADGAPNPANPCLVCNAAVPTGWSLAPVDTQCDDGDACSHDDKCQFGSCFGTPYSCDGLGCCVGDGSCTTVAPEGVVENCSGGVDDDCDGITDEGTPEQCGDVTDNDCDGATDESGNTWGEVFFARPYNDAGTAKIAIYTSNGDGTFQNHKLVQMPDNRVYGIVAIGDFDADRFLDLIVATPDVGAHTTCSASAPCGGGQICQSGICLNTCSAPATDGCPASVSAKTGTCTVGDECFDIDQYNDSNADRCLPPTRVYLVRERCPDGATELVELGIQRRNSIEYPMLKPGESIQTMVDVNNDGQLDMVVRSNWELNTGATLINNGSGVIFGRVDNTIKPRQCCGWVNSLTGTPKDIDGDGIVDMVGWCNPNGGSSAAQFAWWKGMGDGYFGVDAGGAWTGLPTAITGGAAAPASLMSTADFDQDGDIDIINGLDDDGNPGSISMLVNRGSGSTLAWATPYVVYDVTPSNTSGSDAPGVGGGTTYDFDRDGFPDLLAGWVPETVCSSSTCAYREIALIRNLTKQPCGEGMTCSNSACVACAPSCGDHLCGDDGCGGSCGECPPAETCVAGRCLSKQECVPDCSGKTCGDNGCGGVCGLCAAGSVCINGACASNCTPSCTLANGKPKPCGPDGCGGQCIILGDKELVVQDQNQSGGVIAPSNAPPRLDEAFLAPALPKNSDDLECSPGYAYDLDRITLRYEWYRNGTFFVGAGDVPVLDASFTQFGENWHCIIRATDGTEWSIPRRSPTRTIGN